MLRLAILLHKSFTFHLHTVQECGCLVGSYRYPSLWRPFPAALILPFAVNLPSPGSNSPPIGWPPQFYRWLKKLSSCSHVVHVVFLCFGTCWNSLCTHKQIVWLMGHDSYMMLNDWAAYLSVLNLDSGATNKCFRFGLLLFWFFCLVGFLMSQAYFNAAYQPIVSSVSVQVHESGHAFICKTCLEPIFLAAWWTSDVHPLFGMWFVI